MSTNEQRRSAAKKKLERQIERRAKQAKRRKTIAVSSVIGVVVIALVVVGVVLLKKHDARIEAEKQAQIKANTCAYQPSKTDKVPKNKNVGLPPNPNPKPRKGIVQVDMQTTAGPIPMAMDRAKAPCTVQSAEHLVRKGFYDDVKCHRETNIVQDKAGVRLQVLQCGDPLGTGEGGPGYTIPDEPPKGLKPAPIKQQMPPGTPAPVVYPRGTVAMAKTQQPNSGGSQFFMVYGTAQLDPDYTVFGSISDSGLQALDKVARDGVDPASAAQSQDGTGAPKTPVKFTGATVDA